MYNKKNGIINVIHYLIFKSCTAPQYIHVGSNIQKMASRRAAVLESNDGKEDQGTIKVTHTINKLLRLKRA